MKSIPDYLLQLQGKSVDQIETPALVIDLDAMVQHQSPRRYAKAWRRDRARLLRNWAPASVLYRWLDATLPPAEPQRSMR